ncbi:hypothetical protein LTR78_004883 [Recurvomyces mirabilis]|uniref:PAC domain-containing protein n=1 Tax=Recurvomyces mirabilis TaxID=574656 RepID=A0AAE0WP77_9PEZI|nr:hypothetical protein LTR78_004883 [Recurvomyces mirabilis]KAK5158053.1 hypothetical protein LTS14_003976 [Recurvomyces mirabilis]
MEAPDVPRSRDGKIKKKFGSTLTSFVKQYPHQTNGRRELRLEDRGVNRPSTGASTTRQKPTSVDTTIHTGNPTHRSIPQNGSTEALHEPLIHDFGGGGGDQYTSKPQYSFAEPGAYHARVSGPHHSDGPDFSNLDDQDNVSDRPHEYSRHSVHVPTRNSSITHTQPSSNMHSRVQSRSRSRQPTGSRKQSVADVGDYAPGSPEDATPTVSRYGAGDRSSAESIVSESRTSVTSIHTLPALQTKGPDNSDAQYLEPVIEDDPRSFDLVAPHQEDAHVGIYELERRGEQMFAPEHLQIVFDDPKLLLKFTGYLNVHRPKSIPMLIYYLDALKAIRAINYANAIAEALDPIRGQQFTQESARPTANKALEEKAKRAFDILVRDDLPAYVAHTWIQLVSVSIQRRITGTLAPHLREASEGLAEVFCLTDPSRPDNPIVFASEEFVRTTQYGMNYVIGRNCRFLQGPKTNPNSVRRFAEACQAGKEHIEVFVNYRRDGSPFMNLLMIAPLMDSRGNIRYYIGAQVDVSGLVKDCSDLEGLVRLVEREEDPEAAAEDFKRKDEFQELSEMFNGAELDTVRKFGGQMHKEYVEDNSDSQSLQGGRRLLLTDPTQDAADRYRDSMASSLGSTIKDERVNGKLEGVYQHYLLVRPAPSLRILFTSPSLRVPGILQSPFLHRIGGSSRVRSDLATALSEGRGVTAKIRWLTRADESGDGEGRPRWIHCTPLLGHSGAVGVWMIVLVEEEGYGPPGQGGVVGGSGRRFRPAPAVANNIGGKEWDSRMQNSQSRSRSRPAANGTGSRRAGADEYDARSLPPEVPSTAATAAVVAVQRRPGVSRGDTGLSRHSAYGHGHIIAQQAERGRTPGGGGSGGGGGGGSSGGAAGEAGGYRPTTSSVGGQSGHESDFSFHVGGR